MVPLAPIQKQLERCIIAYKNPAYVKNIITCNSNIKQNQTKKRRGSGKENNPNTANSSLFQTTTNESTSNNERKRSIELNNNATCTLNLPGVKIAAKITKTDIEKYSSPKTASRNKRKTISVCGTFVLDDTSEETIYESKVKEVNVVESMNGKSKNNISTNELLRKESIKFCQSSLSRLTSERINADARKIANIANNAKPQNRLSRIESHKYLKEYCKPVRNEMTDYVDRNGNKTSVVFHGGESFKNAENLNKTSAVNCINDLNYNVNKILGPNDPVVSSRFNKNIGDKTYHKSVRLCNNVLWFINDSQIQISAEKNTLAENKSSIVRIPISSSFRPLDIAKISSYLYSTNKSNYYRSGPLNSVSEFKLFTSVNRPLMIRRF